MWRMGSCGEAGPFIGLSYGHSIALVQRWQENPGADIWDLKAEVLRDFPEEPDILGFTANEIYEGMATSYSFSHERTSKMLKRLQAKRLAAAAGGAGEE